MKKMLALLVALLLPLPCLAQFGSRVLYDSGSVAAGAQIQTPVLDFTTAKVSELTVIVDNTAGTVLRSLTLTSYLEDGSTVVDSIPLRLVGFGAAPTGSVYAPGSVRGTVGPHASLVTTGTFEIYNETGPSNATYSSPNLWTEDCDELIITGFAGGGAFTGAIGGCQWNAIDDAGAAETPVNGNIGGAGFQSVYGVWAPGATSTRGYFAISSPVPRRILLNLPAIGVGQTLRTTVICRGRVPGTFSVQIILPMKGRLTLAAGGSGAARLTVLGR